MVKKMSIFLDAPLRQKLEKDHNFRRGPVPRMIFKLIHEIGFAAMNDMASLANRDEEKMQEQFGAAWKLFTSCYSAQDTLTEELFQAHRIEFHLRSDFYKAITLDVSLYRRNERQPFRELRFGIDERTGKVGIAGG